MPAPRKYPNELRERAQRLVAEAMSEDPSLSLNAAVKRIGARVGVLPDTLRGWVKQARIDARSGARDDDQRRGDDQGVAGRGPRAQTGQRDLVGGVEFLRAGAGPATAVVTAFIDGHREKFGVEPICRVLTEHGCKIAPSTYYAARHRPPSPRVRRDERVLAEIRRVHTASGGRYGARKVYHQLRREAVVVAGHLVAKCTVERLMAADGLRGVHRGRRVRTTRPDTTVTRPPDLVKRDFTAAAPNRLWVVDFTYVATWSGFVYVAFATDVFSRMIVGWRAARTMATELPLDALDMALWHRSRAGHNVAGLVHHSDAGSQYTAIRYTDRLLDSGALASIGSVGDSYDNALAESVIGLYKTELVFWQGPWKGAADLELATLTWVDWFNHTRLHSALGYRTPVEAETDHYQSQAFPVGPAGDPR